MKTLMLGEQTGGMRMRGLLTAWVLLVCQMAISSARAQGEIQGTVTSGAVGQAGVVVEVYDEGDPWNAMAQGVTAANGSYAVTGLAAGTYRVRFDGGEAGFFSTWYGAVPFYEVATAVVVATGATTGIDAELAAAGQIVGFVKTAGGSGIAGVEVGLRAYGGESFGDPTQLATTDATGQYHLRGLNAGDYRLEINGRPAGYQPAEVAGPVSVALGATASVPDVVLMEGGSISGQVTDGHSNPVPGVQVRLANSNDTVYVYAVTDVSGNYTAGGLEADEWSLYFNGGPVGYNSLYLNDDFTPQRLTVTTSSALTGVDQALTITPAVKGRVTLASGVGVPGIQVGVYGVGEPWPANSTQTDAEGYYTVGWLAAGSYQVSFAGDTGAYERQWWNGAADQSTAATVVVGSGAHTTGIDAVLTPSTGLTVWGRVMEEGSPTVPVPDASVTASGVDSYYEMTDSSGYYLMQAVTPGAYTFQATSPWGGAWMNGSPVPVDWTGLTGAVRQDATLPLGGQIQGRVVDESGVGIEGIRVSAMEDGPVEPGWSPFGTFSDAQGYYAVKGLATGDYKVKFEDWGGGIYLPKWYLDAADFATATVVGVVQGSVVMLSDEELSSGPAILGQVTDEVSGLPISGVWVYSFDAANVQSWGVQTNAQGEYRLSNLAAGDYRIQFQGQNAGHYNEFHHDKADLASADTVTLGAVDVTVNAQLTPGATLSGTVTSSGSPLSGVTVEVYASNNSFNVASSATTNTLGQYQARVFGTVAGQYKIRFSKTGYLSVWHDAQGDFSTATLVPTVPLATNSSEAVTGLDAVLVASGSIAGTVVDDGTGLPLSSVRVIAYPAGQMHPQVAVAYTSTSGQFTLNSLDSGDYDLYFDGLVGYLPQWHAGVLSQSLATSVTVTRPNQVTLPVERLVQSGGVAGRVTDDTTGLPIEDALAYLYHDGASGYADYDWTDANGEFQFSNVVPGSDYQVRYTKSGYAEQWYDVKATRETADLLTVGSGQVTMGVDAQLFQRGSISGAVTDAHAGSALSLAGVELYNASGAFLLSATTNSQGGYLFGNLVAGDYKLRFHRSGYVDEWFNDQTDEASATVVTVAGTGVQTANAALTNVGIIAGRVTAEDTSSGVSDLSVAVYQEGGAYAGNATPDANGNYVVRGLNPGSYRVLFSPHALSPYMPEWYANAVDLASGTPVVLGAVGDVVTGIDAALSRGGSVVGTIAAAVGGQPVESVFVRLDAVTAGGDVYIKSTTTSASGTYGFQGLAAGDYRVTTSHAEYLPEETPVFTVTPPGAVTQNLSLSLGSTVRGTVTLAGSGAVLEHAMVALYTAAGGYVKSVQTDATGVFTLSGVEAGSYAVRFSLADHFTQWHAGQADQAAATLITVSPPTPVTGIDAAMVRGASLAGTVTDAESSALLSGASVKLYDAADAVVRIMTTVGDGAFRFDTLPAGSYRVGVSRYGFIEEWYAEQATLASATPVVLAAGEDRTGIDTALLPLGGIRGRLTDGGGTGAGGVRVNLYNDQGELANYTTTDGNGDYGIENVPTGGYKLQFDGSGTPYLGEWFNDQPDQASATLVTVTAPTTTTGVDAVLAAGAVVSGVVTDAATSGPLAGVMVTLRTQPGDAVDATTTDASGAYAIVGLVAGTYVVEFGRAEFFTVWHNGQPDLMSATPVVLTPPAVATVNAALTRGATVAGVVTHAITGVPLASAKAVLRTAAGAEVASAFTAADGGYRLDTLPAGSYRIEFERGGFVSQWYDQQVDLASSTPVALVLGEDRTGVDAAMMPLAAVSGRVTNTGGSGVGGVTVYLTDQASGTWATTATDSNGDYLIPNVASGSYSVQFSTAGTPYLEQWYNGKATEAAADMVIVTVPNTTAGIDAVLQTGARLAGVVRGVNEAAEVTALANASVSLYDADGWVADTQADGSGAYEFIALPQGSYKVRAWAAGHLTRWHDDKFTEDAADFLALIPPQDLTGIDLLLPEPARITGRVMEGAQPLGGVGVNATENGGGSGASAVTLADGTYTLEGLDDGEYTIRFDGTSQGYFVQFHAGQATAQAATPVTVTAPGVVALGDETLVQSGGIAGNIVDTSGIPVAGVEVRVLTVGNGSQVGLATSDGNGDYRVGLLQTGSYRLEASATGYLKQYYGGVRLLSEGTPVAVTVGVDTAGIDFQMLAPARIAGVLTNQEAQPVVNATVYLYDEGLNYEGGALTNASGAYTLANLWPGSYRIRYAAEGLGYLSQWHQGRATGETSDVVVMAEGDQFSANAVLVRPGVITGTVRTLATPFTAEEPLAGIAVRVSRAADNGVVANATTAADGTYQAVSPAMVAGEYVVSFLGTTAGFFDQWSPQKDTLAEAVPVTVTDETTVSGIDAALRRPRVFAEVVSGTGTVTPVDQEVPYNGDGTVGLSQTPHWSPSLVMDSRYPTARNLSAYSVPVTFVREDVTLSVTYTAVADLVVPEVTQPAEAFNGESIVVTWTVANHGLVEAVGPWTDRVWLSDDNAVGGDTFLKDFSYSGSLPAGETITRVQTVTLPKSLATAGPYYLVVTADVYDHVTEGRSFEAGSQNNHTVGAQPVQVLISPSPDLVVQTIGAAANAFSGQETLVTWQVHNQGNGGTTAPTWTDEVYLSVDDQLDGSDVYLGATGNASFLPAGESYTSSATVRLPNGTSGPHHLLVKANGNHKVDESDLTNNVAAAAFNVTLTPPPDLRVTAVTAPTSAFSGQATNLSWTVTNLGDGPTVSQNWTDRVYLSTDSDTEISGGDVLLGSYSHSGALEPGELYTRTEAPLLPPGISGSYFIKVWTDAFNSVFEHTDSTNNIAVSTPATNVVLQGPDLEVVSFTLASTPPILSGHQVAVSWTVENFGTAGAPNSWWKDSLYLFTGPVFDRATATLLGSRTRYGQLPSGERYSATQGFNLPNGLAGDYQVVLVTDADLQVVELDDDNNTSAQRALTLESRPADLTVTQVTAPPSAESGQAVTLSWTVENQGTGGTFVSSWRDRIYITADATLATGAIELGSADHSGELADGASYTHEQLVVVPFDLASGSFYFFVQTDVNAAVYEDPSTRDNNRSAGSAVAVTSVTADLATSGVSVPAVIDSGTSVTVGWMVTNQGSGRTSRTGWYDRVYLSPTPSLADPAAVRLDSVPHDGELAVGAAYTGSRSVVIPRELSGTYYVGVLADYYENVADANRSNNASWTGSPVAVQFTPAPDLSVGSITAATTGISGSSLQVGWTVTNLDAAAPASPEWSDSVYLSRDRIFDAGDSLIGHATHTGGMAAGGSYSRTETFTIPLGLSGPFYAFVVTDRYSRVFEADRRSNNTAYRAEPILITLPSPSDLVVTTVTAPATATLAAPLHIEYAVANPGVNETNATSVDAVYLSAQPTWTADAVLLGRVQRTSLLASGASYTVTLDAEVPGILPGAYHVLVRTDIFNTVLESDEANNLGVSPSAVAVDAPLLVLDQPETVPLAQSDARYFRMEIESAGEAVLVTLDSASSTDSNELYVAFGRVPTRGDFDFAYGSPYSADQQVLIPLSRNGTYYVLAYANKAAPASMVTLEAEIIPFSVLAVDPEACGDAGRTTLRIQGARFGEDTTFDLVHSVSGAVVPAALLHPRNSGLAFATFDLLGGEHGSYTLRATAGSGAVATLPDALTVATGIGPRVTAQINGQPSVRVGRDYVFYVDYGNIGDSDGTPPLLIIRTTTDTAFGLTLEDMDTTAVQLFASSRDGVAGILRPGEKVSLPLYFHSRLPTNFTVDIVTEEDTTPLDWDQLEADIRPLDMSDTQWATLWPALQARLGGTWGDYVRTLKDIASLLGARGVDTTNVDLLFEELFNQEAGYATGQIAGQLINAETGQLVTGVTMSAFQGTLGDWEGSQVNQTVTNDAGEFVFTDVPAGDFVISAAGYVFDDPRTVTVGPNQDALGLVLFAYPEPEGGAPGALAFDDREMSMTVDSAGVTHAVWVRAGDVWHAWRSGGSWVEARPITEVQATGEGSLKRPQIRSAPNVLDGTDAGLVVTWQTGDDNEARIHHAVGRWQAGGYEWSEPAPLTGGPYGDFKPALELTPSGDVVVVFLRRDAEAESGGVPVWDDHDLYYGVHSIASSALTWQAPLAFGTVEGRGFGTLGSGGSTSTFDFTMSGSTPTLPGRIPMIGGKSISFDNHLMGSVAGGCSVGGTLSAGVSVDVFKRITLALSAGGSLGWDWDCKSDRWKFKTATMGFSGSAEGTIPAFYWVLPGDGWLADKYVEVDIGPLIGIGFSGVAGWTGGEFGGWPNAGSVSLTGTLGGKGQVTLFDEAAKGAISLTGTIQGEVYPKTEITSTSIALNGEASSGSFKKTISLTWTWQAKEGWFGFGSRSVEPPVRDPDLPLMLQPLGFQEIIDDEAGTLVITIDDPVLTWEPRAGTAAV